MLSCSRSRPQRTYSRRNRRSSFGLTLGESSSSQSSQEDNDLSFSTPESKRIGKGDCSFDSESSPLNMSINDIWETDMEFDAYSPVSKSATPKRARTAPMAISPMKCNDEEDTPRKESVKRRNSWSVTEESDKENADPQPTMKKKRTISLPKIVITKPTKTRSTPQQKRKRNVLEKEKSRNNFELQVMGENETIMDELEFNVGGLKPTQPIVVRRGSILNLAGLLNNYEATLLIRSRGLFGKIFEVLEENPTDKILSLNMAALIYLIFRDRRNSEFITEKCVMSLLSFISAVSDDAEKVDQQAVKRVTALLGDTKPAGLMLEITPSSLALEAMVCLAQNGNVFKDAIRHLNGFDTVHTLIKQSLLLLDLQKPVHRQLVGLSRLENYSKLLENVTNSDRAAANQKYLLSETSDLVETLLRLTTVCNELLQNGLSHEAAGLVNCITGALRVLINLSNGNEEGCRLIGKLGGLVVVMRMMASFCAMEENLEGFQLGVLHSEDMGKDAKQIAKRNICFDGQLLALGLLINLVEKDVENREQFHSMASVTKEGHTPIQFLALLFQHRFNANKVDGKVLVEYSVTAAYTALLLGCLMKDNNENKKAITAYLPLSSFADLSLSLREFIALQSQSGLLSDDALASATEIIKLLEKKV